MRDRRKKARLSISEAKRTGLISEVPISQYQENHPHSKLKGIELLCSVAETTNMPDIIEEKEQKEPSNDYDDEKETALDNKIKENDEIIMQEILNIYKINRKLEMMKNVIDCQQRTIHILYTLVENYKCFFATKENLSE